MKKRCVISNSSTQSGLQRTDAQIAANRALSLAVGPSKRHGVVAQASGANGGSSLQQSQPVVRASPQEATSVPTAKSRVPAQRTTANSSLRAELMVTANSAAAAACMSRPAIATLVPKAEPVKNCSATAASLARPSGISSAMNAEHVKAANTAFLPRPSNIISPPKAEPFKTLPASSFPRPSSIQSAPNAEPVKTVPRAPLPRQSGISPAPNSEPVKAASAAYSPRPSGNISASNTESVKAASAASFPRLSGISSAPNSKPVIAASAAYSPRPSGNISASNAGPAKTVSAASMPRPSSITSASKAEPLKTASAVSLPRPSSIQSAQKVAASATNTQMVGSRCYPTSSSPCIKPASPIVPFSKGPTIQNKPVPAGFVPSRFAPTPKVPIMPQKPSTGPTVTTASWKPVDVQMQTLRNRQSPQPNKTTSKNSLNSN